MVRLDSSELDKVCTIINQTDRFLKSLVVAKWTSVRFLEYRGTSLIRNRPHPGPYSRAMPRAVVLGGGGRVKHVCSNFR